MELDDLKTRWRELDGRLDRIDAKMNRLSVRVADGTIISRKRRLGRVLRLQIFLLFSLPLLLSPLFAACEPGLAVQLLLGLFICAMLVRQFVMLALLAKIEPAQMTVTEACAAVLRLRTWHFAGAAAGVLLAVPLAAAFALYLGRLGVPSTVYGFVAGSAVGIPLGVRIFLRKLGELNGLHAALRDAEQ